MVLINFMVFIEINEIDVWVKEEISILEACRYIGILIPRFCFHETLSIAGNCRMCLVRLEDDEELVVSCLTSVEESMSIISGDISIQKIRDDIIMFLLINHPLDCPICDQGGECDLQDQTYKYGNPHSKYFFNKKTVSNKNLNVFIKTIMTRCICCTRCVRFSLEVLGVESLGILNRGVSSEIGFYISNILHSEISSNVIDLCPVGAITAKDYLFKTRSWELFFFETIDLNDNFRTNIIVNVLKLKNIRILTKFNFLIKLGIFFNTAKKKWL
jgi:NADH dehydrogenase/NADH:ubiquinone oxidoreductase subunit G